MNFYIYHSDNQNSVYESNWCFPLFFGNRSEIIVKDVLAISQGLVIVTLTEKVLGTSNERLFKVIIFFIPFQVFFILFQLSSKYLLK